MVDKPYRWTFWSWNRVFIAGKQEQEERRHWGDHPNISNSKLVPMADWEDFCWYYGDCCCCCFPFTTSTRERRPCGITNTYFGHGDLFISSCKYSTTFGWSEPTVRTMKSRYAMSAAITGERNVHLHWLEKEGRGEGDGDGDWPGAVTCIMDYMYVSCWTSSGILLFVCIINSNSGRVTLLCAEFIGNLSVFFSRAFCSISGHWYGLLLSMSTRSARKLQ